MIDRRALLKQSGAVMAALGTASIFDPLSALADTVKLPFDNGERPLVKYPQKRPMIGLTSRPPQLETPFSVFNDGAITPNDAFFVRYHLAGIPLEIDPDTFTVEVKGKVDKPLKLSLAELKRMPSVEIVAVNQCSGNSRGFFEPRVAGGQLGNGAMGNARWIGVPLKAVLDRAGVEGRRAQVTFNGLDDRDRRQDARLRQGARHRPGARRRGHAGLCHERRGPALPQRLSAPPRRAGLLRHLLGEASQRDHGHRQRVRRLLDEDRLPHSRQRLRLHPARHAAQDDDSDRPLHRALVHHQRRRRRARSRPASRSCSRASPSTAARASRRSPSRPTAARAGRRPSSARISASTRSANGSCRSLWRPAPHELKVRATSNGGQTQPMDAAVESRRLHAQRRRNHARHGSLRRRP